MLRFIDRREIESVTQLTEVQRQQLRTAGDPLPAVLWRIVQGDRHVFDAWFYPSDQGAIFRAGTIEQVAAIEHGGLACADRALRADIGPAMVEARLLSQHDPAYGEFAELLAKRKAGVVVAPILAEGTMPETPHALAEAIGLAEVSRAELAQLELVPAKKRARRRAKPKPAKPKPKRKPKPAQAKSKAKKRRRTR